MRVDDIFDDEAGISESPDRALYGDELDLLGQEVLDELEMLGYDVSDPDLLGGPFRRLFRKIRDRVRARRKKRAEKKARAALGPEQAETPYSISTPRGTLTASSAGLSLTKPAPGAPVIQQQTGFNPIALIQKNPLLLMVPVAGIAIMMMGKKRGGGNGFKKRGRR